MNFRASSEALYILSNQVYYSVTMVTDGVHGCWYDDERTWDFESCIRITIFLGYTGIHEFTNLKNSVCVCVT